MSKIFEYVSDYYNKNRDRILLYISVPFILLWTFTSLSYIGLFLLTPLFIAKTKEHWELIKSRMKSPGFGKGFLLLTGCLFAVSGIMTLIYGGMIVTGPLFPFILALTQLFITLKVSKILALVNNDAKVAYPIFLFIGTAGLISINKFFYFAIKYIIIGGLTDFWAGLGLSIGDDYEMFKPADNIDVVSTNSAAVNITDNIDISPTDSTVVNTTNNIVEVSTDSTDVRPTNLGNTYIDSQSLDEKFKETVTSFETNSFADLNFVGSFNTFSNNTFSVDPNFCINNIGDNNITIAGPDNSPIMHIANGKIFGADNMQIGSFKTDLANGRRVFYDINHDTIFSADKTGNYFNGLGQPIGTCVNLGSMTTFTTTTGEGAYSLNINGSAITDIKTGKVLGYVYKK